MDTVEEPEARDLHVDGRGEVEWYIRPEVRRPWKRPREGLTFYTEKYTSISLLTFHLHF